MDIDRTQISFPSILVIEPFYGGSHFQFLETIFRDFPVDDYLLVTLSAKKWHWRARTSALCVSQKIPKIHQFKILFASSVLNLSELLGLRPDLQCCRKIIYFHENQLIYPTKNEKSRDFQYGYNQITTCLCADAVYFNSNFNKDSFLKNIQKHLNIQPDNILKNISQLVEPKCDVLYYPINFRNIPLTETQRAEPTESHCLHIVWPHRWEHDKNPNLLFEVLFELKENGIGFNISILGEHTHDVPEIFSEAKLVLKDQICHFGFVAEKIDYYTALKNADVVVSTADHEFFGVAMIEAAYCECLPIVPNKLVYPEMYPKYCTYNTKVQLYKLLKRYCLYPKELKKAKDKFLLDFDFSKYSCEELMPKYKEMLGLKEPSVSVVKNDN